MSAAFEERVGALGEGREDRSRNGKHLAVVVEGKARGNERAGFFGGFDHDGAECETGNDAVSHGKRADARLRIRRKFAYEASAARCNGAGKGEMISWRDAAFGKAVSEHGRRESARLKRALVRHGVESQRQTAYHHESRARKFLGKFQRHVSAVVGRFSSADDRDAGVFVEDGDISFRIEKRGRIGNFFEEPGVRVVPDRCNGNILFVQDLPRAVRASCRRSRVLESRLFARRKSGLGEFFCAGAERRFRIWKCAHEFKDCSFAHARRFVDRVPEFKVIVLHGAYCSMETDNEQDALLFLFNFGILEACKRETQKLNRNRKKARLPR